MEKKERHDSCLDRSKRVTWQDDRYLDLQGAPGHAPLPPQAAESGWMARHQDQLRRFATPALLEEVLTHLREEEVLSCAQVAGVKAAGRLQDQVQVLVSQVEGGGGGLSLQSFIQSSASPAARLILKHDALVEEHRAALLQRLNRTRGPRLNVSSRTLLVLDGLSDLQLKEHDLMQVGVTRGGKRTPLQQLGLDRLLEPLTRVSLSPRVSLTVGVAGIGKTTWVRRFVRQWSEGALCRHVSFVLPLACCELNALERLSAERLLNTSFPHLGDAGLVLGGSCQTLLVLDGLDQFQGTLNFSEAAACSDPRKEVPVDDLITNILRGNLLPGVAVWVTSRPGAASLVPGGLVDRMTEIPGFSPEDIRTFLQDHVSEKDVASKMWAHLEAHKVLLVMCYIPCVCRLVADTLSYLLQSGVQEGLPKTATELYAQYCCMKAEVGEPRGREPVKAEQLHGNNRKLLGNLGRLAFYGLLKHKYTFTEPDLRAYAVDVLWTQSSFGAGLLVREESVFHTVYRFTHLTLQEFLAAVFYHTSSKRTIFDLFSESSVSWPKIGFQNHFRSAFQHAQQADDGHLDVFVRFLAGLLCPAALRPLAGLLVLSKEDGSHRMWAAGFLQGLLASGGAVVSLRQVNLAYCLHELQHSDVLRGVQEDLRLGSLAGKLTRPHCVVLGFLLQVSPECSERVNLSASLDSATLKCLLPQLLYCSHLRLDNNQFRDDVTELLGSLLSAKDCNVHKLSLADNSISSKGAKALSRALLVNRTLTSLSLRSNNIGSRGARFLAEALKMNQSMTSLNLQSNAIEEGGASALAEVLLSNRKLASLNIRKNSIGPGGAKKMAAALKTNRSLTKLLLCSNQLGDTGTVALAEALTFNQSLQSLQLQSNSISNEGMTALTRALRVNRRLVSLNLRENSIGVEGARHMASALLHNHSLQELDLTANLLHDEGVQAIAAAIKVNHGLTALHLQWNFIKSTAAKALADALQANATVTLLDLQENAIGNEGVVFLAEALKTNSSLRTLCLQGVSAGSGGAVALAEALLTNQSVHTLDLRGNAVGMEGAKALATALKTNRSLKALNLQENALGMDGAIFIATALTGNHQLSYINLQGNGIGQSGAKVIADAIRASAATCVVEI